MKILVIISVFMLFFSNMAFSQCSNPDCGSDFAVCGNTAQLNVEDATTGYWTAYNGSVVVSPAPVYSPSSSAANASVTISGDFNGHKILKFIWTDNSGPCTDTVFIEFVEVPLLMLVLISMSVEIALNSKHLVQDLEVRGSRTDATLKIGLTKIPKSAVLLMVQQHFHGSNQIVQLRVLSAVRILMML